MIDTHCHFYSSEFAQDVDQAMIRAQEQGVRKFFLPAIDSSTINQMLMIEEQYRETCFAMIGVHPCSIKNNYIKELELVKHWLTKRKFAAIGEIGLDMHWDTTFEKEQTLAFREQIELALAYQLPIVIHTRNAMPPTIEIIKEYVPRGVHGIFHCFSGSLQDAQTIVEMGFLLGVGGVITYKNAGIAEVIQQIDMQHLVLETDAPYLAPVPFRGKRNEPAHLKLIAEKLAALKNISLAEVDEITTANAERIFKR